MLNYHNKQTNMSVAVASQKFAECENRASIYITHMWSLTKHMHQFLDGPKHPIIIINMAYEFHTLSEQWRCLGWQRLFAPRYSVVETVCCSHLFLHTWVNAELLTQGFSHQGAHILTDWSSTRPAPTWYIGVCEGKEWGKFPGGSWPKMAKKRGLSSYHIL